jgi:hypothetical protein
MRVPRVKSVIKKRLPPSWRWRLRRLNRFRWYGKYQALRACGVKASEQPVAAARFVLLDPELDNFTYELENEDELGDFLARALSVQPQRIASYLREAKDDRELRRELHARAKWRVGAKRPFHFGRRLVWYAVARELKPRIAVEAGIQDGLGSALLLRALERNAGEKHEGRLLSFDVLPGSGWLVPDGLRSRWQPRFESTRTALRPALRGLEVGMMIHDSENSYDCEHFELSTAVEHAASKLALITYSARTGAMRDVCARAGAEYHVLQERPRGHFYPGELLGLSVLDAGQARAAASRA